MMVGLVQRMLPAKHELLLLPVGQVLLMISWKCVFFLRILSTNVKKTHGYCIDTVMSNARTKAKKGKHTNLPRAPGVRARVR